MGTAINSDTAKSKKYSLTGGTTSEKNNFFIYGGADDLFSRGMRNRRITKCWSDGRCGCSGIPKRYITRKCAAACRPALVENVENLENYDTVFLGYPNWWYGVPMPLLTFLEQNDLYGKQVYLFCSHGTGGLASSVELITEAAPEAEISEDIFDCYEEDASSSQTDIQNWIAGLGF